MTTRSYCNQALIDAGLPIDPPDTLAMLTRSLAPYPDSKFARVPTLSDWSDPDYWKHPQREEPLSTED